METSLQTQWQMVQGSFSVLKSALSIFCPSTAIDWLLEEKGK
ncbi:MAG TPA: hypothetical protein V6C84_25770 [Coleofasciculaceae cyanobacterium]